MSKVGYLSKKVESIEKYSSLLPKVEVKRLVGKLMLAVMLWQAVAQPALALSSFEENEASKSDKDTNATSPIVQNPGDLVIARHAPSVEGSRIEGTVRVLLAETANLSSNGAITGDLLIPGSPRINLNSNTTYNGTVIGTGNPEPSSHSVSLSSGVALRHVVTRTDAITISPVANPPQPKATRDVTLNPNDSPGDFTAIRSITINPNYGALTVPPGIYGNLVANNNSTFVLGVNGQSTTYNLQAITLNSNSGMQILGTVTINVLGNVSLNSQTNMGVETSPISLLLNVAQGGLTLDSDSKLYGVVKAPNGEVNLKTNSLIKGLVTCDRLTANSNSKIQPLVADTNRPIVKIDQPINGATFNQTQVTVSGTVADESVTSIKVNNVTATFNGSTYLATVPLNIGTNTITAVATDAFNNIGQSQVMVSLGDGANQLPVVNASNDLNVSLPAQATLTGTVTDDGKPTPPGQVTIAWSKVSGPGTVTFSSPSTAITNAGFSTAGVYVLQLSASDGQLSSSDRVTVTVTNNQTNKAPVVNAGADQALTLPAQAALNGSVTDDGLPNNQLAINWSKVSGAGTVTFTNPTAATTTASFSAGGVYVLRLTAGDGQLSSSDDVQVTVQAPAARFGLLASPVSVTTVQNGTATYMINVISDDPNFRQLIGLSASALPGKTRVTFNPQQVVAGSASTLTIDLNNSSVTAGTYNLTVTASASIGGIVETHSANITLVVQAAGQTTISGRVLSSEGEALSGVAVSIEGKSAVTDAAGTFLISNVTAGAKRAILVDGRTASTPGRTYPVVAEPVSIVAGQPNQMPYTFYLPRIDTQYEVIVPNTSASSNQKTTVTTPRVKGLSTVIPAGANLRNRDGSAVTRVSMTPVAIDRTPAPLPPNLSTTMVYTNQPGGAISDIAMPVTYPNSAGLEPNTLAPLYTFNHDTVEWEQYGMGKVSADGRTIVPEIDPTTGRQYGLKDFSWHFVLSKNGNPSPPGQSCLLPKKNGVHLPTGVKEEANTDISFGGARGGLALSRVYTTDLVLVGTGTYGQFGKGTRSNYEIKLIGDFAQSGAGKIVWPNQVLFQSGDRTEAGGVQFNYSSTAADGSMVFTTSQYGEMLGDTISKMSNGSYQYRFKSGDMMTFDSTGSLTSMVDRNNNTTSLTYTGNNLTRVTDSVGRSINMTYDGQGRITSATDPIGRTWTYSYNPAGYLSAVTDPLNNSMQYSYGSSGLMQTITDKRNNLVNTITYTPEGRVVSQRFADGGVEQYEYIFSGDTITRAKVTDPENRITSHRFNSLGYIISETDGLGQPSVITRDTNTNLPSQVNGPCGCPENVKTYDAKGNVLTVTDRLGQIMRYEYDPIYSFVTKVTDKNGHITRLTYDSRGNRTSTINAKGETTTFAYDQFGQQTSMTDALNHTWSMVYDAQGNVTSKTDPLTNTSTMTYDGIGRTLSMSDPLNRTSSMVYDQLSRVISSTDSANATTTFTFDQNGNQTAMTNALNNTWTMQFNSKNRMISQKYPLTPNDNGIQREMRMEYNLNDEMTASISPSNRTTRYTYDARGQRKSMTDPLSGVVSYNYDINQNLIILSDQRNNVTSYDYDELYRVIKATDSLGKFTRYNYDPDGNVTSSIDRLNRTTSTIYDQLDRPITVTYVDAVVTMQYDAAGRKTRVDDTQFGSSFIAWAYDNANRLLSESTNQGIVSYTYNQASQRVSMTAADRPIVNYTYDNYGRLSTIAQNLGQALETFTYNYDILSRRASLQRPNSITTDYSYDQSNRLTRLKHQKINNPAIEDFQYAYNADDEISSINSLFSNNQLPVNQTVSTANSTNRIQQFGTASFTFDDMGQTTSKTIAGSGTTQYQWDARGRLIQVILPSNQQINYSYDSIERRNSSSANSINTRFLYDGDDVILDTVNNTDKIDYLNVFGTDQKLRQSSITDGLLYFIQDHLNSTVSLTNSIGNTTEQIAYQPFGGSIANSLTRYGYTGRELDSITELTYYRARWYDSQQGRFLTEDPTGVNYEDYHLNLYEYANNSFVSYSDPTGEFPFLVVFGVIIVLYALDPGKVNAPRPGDPTYRDDSAEKLCSAAYNAVELLRCLKRSSNNNQCSKKEPQKGNKLASGRGKWTCIAVCNIQFIPNVKPGYQISATRSGNSESAACMAAMDAVTAMSPRDSYCRHPHCTSCWRR